MRYMKAADVLPPDLLAQVQAYIDGEYLYIPRRETSRKPWGAANGRKAETLARNQEIYRRYREDGIMTGSDLIEILAPFFLETTELDIFITHHIRVRGKTAFDRFDRIAYHPIPILVV